MPYRWRQPGRRGAKRARGHPAHRLCLEATQRIKEALPQASVGIGTVLTPAQYRQAEQVGADFVVTPGTTEALYRHGVSSPVPMLPGVATVSELMIGWQFGYRRFKFFPAEASGGVKALKAFAGPIPEARFCPPEGSPWRTLMTTWRSRT